MKTYSKIILCMILFMQGQGNLFAQISDQVRSEILQIQKIHEKNKRISQEILIQVFPDWNSQTVVEEMKGWMKKDDRKERSRFSEIEYLSTERNFLSLDHKAKTMIWINNGKKFPKSKPELDLDELLALCSQVEMDTEQGLKKLSFTFEDQQFQEVEVLYQDKHFIIEKVRWYFAQAQNLSAQHPHAKARMEMSFSNIELNPKWEPNTFSLKQFISQEKGTQAVPSTAFQQYQLISY